MKKSLLCAVLSLLATAFGLSPSYAKTLEELLVEKGVISKTEADSTTDIDAAKVYWNKGTRLEFPNSGFTSGFSLFTQERYTYTDSDENDGADNTSSFNIEKARLKIFGSVLHEEFDYVFNTEFEDSDGASLLDAYLNWNACQWGSARMGQYKPAYGRQFQTSESVLQFPDRTEVSDFFSVGRQGGASASVFSEDKELVVSAGIFNGLSDGEGRNEPGLDSENSGFLEARYSPIGKIDSFVEGDVDYSDEMGLSFGAAYAYQDNRNDLGAGLEKIQSKGFIADINAKVRGFSFHGEYFYSSIDADSYSSKLEPSGFYTQLGYFLVPKKFEIAARFGLLDCDSAQGLAGTCEDPDKINETGVTLNYYFWKHYLKLQLGYSLINNRVFDDKRDDMSTNKWIFQLSSWF